MSWKRFSGYDVGDSPSPVRALALDTYTGEPVILLARPRTRYRYRQRSLLDGVGDWGSWQDGASPSAAVLPGGAFSDDTVQETTQSQVEVYELGQPWRITVRYTTRDNTTLDETEAIETQVFVPGNTYDLENVAPLGNSRFYNDTDVMVDVPGPPV